MTDKTALIVDDEPDIRELLEITLGRMNLVTTAAADLTTAREHLQKQSFDLCLTDMHLPDGNGLDLVRHITEEQPDLPVAVITAFGSMDTAITALKAGAFDFLQKPIDLDQLRALVDKALRVKPIAGDKTSGKTKLLGQSKIMEGLRQQISKLARSQAPIYISGESGSGKEVAARLIHEQGPRASAAFVPVNCGAIPSELMESELFGHTKGSFTGAVADSDGLFKTAEGGTLFLDEVADLPLVMQVKLLRAIQEKTVRPIGAPQEINTDVRVLSATHKDLANEVAQGRFRQDLYYRLNVIELNMPSLRERPEDIPELADMILEKLAADYGQPLPSIDEQAMTSLMNYGFPGNVRELENTLERAFTLCDDSKILAGDLQLGGVANAAISQETPAQPALGRDPANDSVNEPTTPPEQDTAANITGEFATVEATVNAAANAGAESDDFANLQPGESLEDYLEKIERTLITQALEKTRWNKTAAAKELGITFRALRYRLKKLELE